eukprot:8433475-Pyramimonas_sp.AAC.1
MVVALARRGAPRKAPTARCAWRSRFMSAHRSRASWRHRKRRERLQWQGPHGNPATWNRPGKR